MCYNLRVKNFIGKIASFIAAEASGWRSGEIAWFLSSELVTLALSLYWKDSPAGIIAATTGIAYTVFAGKGKISCSLFGAINTPIYAYLAWKSGYYGDMALNIYYFFMMSALVSSWRRHRPSDGVYGIERTRLSRRERFLWAIAVTAGSLALWQILVALDGSRPLCDALTNTLSIAAMILTVKRCVEQWAAWIAVDLIEVFMWFKVYGESGTSVSLLIMWTMFLANGIYLWRVWLRDAARRELSLSRSA